MKGFNIYSYAPMEDVQAAIDTGATLLRYQAFVEPDLARRLSLPEWSRFLTDNYIPKIAAIADVCAGTNAKLIVDLHQPPGGAKGNRAPIYSSTEYRGAFTWTWQQIATRFKGVPSVLGYGVLNEPPGTGAEVRKLMQETINTIRAIDSNKIISVACAGGQVTNADWIGSFGTTGIWYEMHMYEPMTFTHQGIGGRPVSKKAPSKEKIAKELRGALKVQQSGRQVFIGEFSASSYARDGERAAYVRDCIELFNEYGFHWCFHCWRENGSPVWSAETGTTATVLREALR